MAHRDKLHKALRDLQTSTRSDLIAQWRRLYHTEPPRYASVELMRQAIAYALQELAIGRLSNVARRELLATASRGPTAPTASTKIKPGTKLLREWGGRTHEIVVTDGGFVWNGVTYRSLSAVAFAITGAKWSGQRFFGLNQAGSRDGRQ